jgi:hypothetical protein
LSEARNDLVDECALREMDEAFLAVATYVDTEDIRKNRLTI